MEPCILRPRSPGFLADCNLPHGSEQFDYVKNLHEVLWRFVKVEYPHASGVLSDWIPIALAAAERRAATPPK